MDKTLSLIDPRLAEMLFTNERHLNPVSVNNFI